MSTGDGAGVSQMGFVWDGSIQHNAILFNQSTNPTTPSNGGGLLIMSAPDTDPICPGEPDADCSHAFGSVGDGIGPNLVINANLIMGNAAEAGSGGGIRFQGVNGAEVGFFPRTPSRWYSVNVTNNIIANNVAGWDGGGVSLQDSIGVNLINNTIISNDSTASSGALFGAFFAPQASSPTPCPRDGQGANIPCVPLSDPQPAGLSSAGHSAEFLASLPGEHHLPAGPSTRHRQPHPGCRQWRLQDGFLPDSVQRCILAEPCFQHRRYEPRCGSAAGYGRSRPGIESAEYGRVRRTAKRNQLLGYRSPW